MRLNADVALIGRRCVLVPYLRCHVLSYHAWMQDPALLQATASEPLSLEEEYAMQREWRRDPAKCTFIVLALDRCSGLEDLLSPFASTGTTSASHSSVVLGADFVARNLPAMVGDVNLFLSPLDDDEDDETEEEGEVERKGDQAPGAAWQAELDVMIAEKEYRGKGLGREACCLMLWYGAHHLQITSFVCKVHQYNVASLTLFEKSLGFERRRFAECFGEWELQLRSLSAEGMVERVSQLLYKSLPDTESSSNAVTLCRIASEGTSESSGEESDDHAAPTNPAATPAFAVASPTT